MLLKIDDAAEAEMDEAAAWYERRSRVALAGLEREVERTLAAIVEAPGRFPVVKRRRRGPEIRRALLVSFPYAVVFITLTDQVRVIAFPHLKRRPFYWLRRANRDV